MIPLNHETAIKYSIELAKIICANPNTNIIPNISSANKIADFIETIQDRLTLQPK